MPSTAACLEQAFAQESGELFIARPRPVHLFAAPPAEAGESDAAPSEQAPTERRETPQAVFPADRAA